MARKKFSGDLKFDNAAQASLEVMKPLWKFRRYGNSGMELSELLPQLGSIADDITLIRSMHTESTITFRPTTRDVW